MTVRRVVALAVAGALLAAACADGDGGSDKITLVTHDSFAVSDDVLAAFTERTGVKVEILPAGDAGATLNQAILTEDDPIGDVLFGVDNTFLSRATRAGIFAPYESPRLARVPDRYELDPRHRLTPVDHGEVCVNDDRAYFSALGVPTPETLTDLADPRYRGLLSVENPATSSPGLAFVLATIAEFGEDGWRDYWERLRDNDVRVVAGWEEAYNGDFSAGPGAGNRPLVVSYASSPPASVDPAAPLPDEAPVGTLLSTCFSQIEFVGILKGTGQEEAARELVDFMLSRRFQEDVPLNMYVFPVREDARLPEVFRRYAQVPDDPLSLPAARIGDSRERWIEEWSETVLR